MKKIDFNDNWLFCKQGSGEKQEVTLPHDAQIIEKRGADISDGGHGYFLGGVYVYEKTFTAPAEWKDKNILVEFEGVYKNCAISLNGKEIGSHKYGYTTFTMKQNLPDSKKSADYPYNKILSQKFMIKRAVLPWL